jgi:hypothetical protein
MLNTFAAAAIVGAAAVSAVPYGPLNGWNGNAPSQSSGWAAPSSTASSYSSGQTPFKFPLQNGFPNVSNATLLQIEQLAHGTLPNTAPPTELNATTITILQSIAFNEAFEVAFFSSLIQNITDNVSGFAIDSPALKTFVLNALVAVQAQEELHFLGTNMMITAAKGEAILPCEYVFPSNDFDSAIRFASTFTDVVLGTLQDALQAFSTDGDAELVPLIGSIIGQEGEQNGYYRSLLDLIPSSQPFKTRSAGPFAFSALNQMVVVNGTCPNSNIIQLPIFGKLNVLTQNIQLKDQTIQFSVESSSTDTSGWSVVFINAQNSPVVEPLQNVQVQGNTITFEAQFNAATLIAEALTISAVTNSAGPFASVDDVAKATLFGPGLIEIN